MAWTPKISRNHGLQKTALFQFGTKENRTTCEFNFQGEQCKDLTRLVKIQILLLNSYKPICLISVPVPMITISLATEERKIPRRKWDLNKQKIVKPIPELKWLRSALKPKNTKDDRVGKLLAERQEWRINQFKKQSRSSIKENIRVEIEGVRLNRRFESLMEKRSKEGVAKQ